MSLPTLFAVQYAGRIDLVSCLCFVILSGGNNTGLEFTKRKHLANTFNCKYWITFLTDLCFAIYLGGVIIFQKRTRTGQKNHNFSSRSCISRDICCHHSSNRSHIVTSFFRLYVGGINLTEKFFPLL